MFLNKISEHPSNVSFYASAERGIKVHDVSSSVLPDLLIRRRILHLNLVTTVGQGVFVIWFSTVEFVFVTGYIRNSFVNHDRELLNDVGRMV